MIRSLRNKLRILALGFVIFWYRDAPREKKIQYMLALESFVAFAFAVLFGYPLFPAIRASMTGDFVYSYSVHSYAIVLFGTVLTLAENVLPAHWRTGIIESKFTAAVHAGIGLLVFGAFFAIRGTQVGPELFTSHHPVGVVLGFFPFVLPMLFGWSFYRWAEDVVATGGETLPEKKPGRPTTAD